MEIIMFFIILILGGIAYFIPSMIANNNKHPQTGVIFALNLFLGWTLLGWVLALVWACMKNEEKQSETIVKGINNSVADEIKKLADLKTQGILTDEEFEARKKQLLEKE